jgi:hypothetical protein
MQQRRSRGSLALAAAALLSACSPGGDEDRPGVQSIRRLNESEYRSTIADLFGRKVEVSGRFEPDARQHGLNALGSASLSISRSGFEQYGAIAHGVLTQALDPKNAEQILACGPHDAKAFDEACARETLSTYGRRLFRRAVSADELAAYLAIAADATLKLADFRKGMRSALTAMLVSPDFLFRAERFERDPEEWWGGLRMDGYSRATRLSYFLWNTTPDEELLAAAESGALHTDEGLRAQVERLIRSPRLADGVRALFGDLLQFDQFANVSKDADLYPKFSQLVASSAQEETLRTVLHQLLDQDGDYRALFYLNETFINRTLAAVYRTRYRFDEPWSRYTFPESDERAGILSQISFLALHSHPGESSPTKRGVAINEIFRCEEMPEPPANVDFSIVQDTNNPRLRTRRARLLAHSEDATCAGCHLKTDPLGLPLDRFDALGQLRHDDNGEPIDVSVELQGVAHQGAPGLGRALAADPQVTRCFVDRVYGYATGRWAERGDRALVESMYQSFEKSGYRLRALFRALVTHPGFFAAPAAAPKQAPVQARASSFTNG